MSVQLLTASANFQLWSCSSLKNVITLAVTDKKIACINGTVHPYCFNRKLLDDVMKEDYITSEDILSAEYNKFNYMEPCPTLIETMVMFAALTFIEERTDDVWMDICLEPPDSILNLHARSYPKVRTILHKFLYNVHSEAVKLEVDFEYDFMIMAGYLSLMIDMGYLEYSQNVEEFLETAQDADLIPNSYTIHDLVQISDTVSCEMKLIQRGYTEILRVTSNKKSFYL